MNTTTQGPGVSVQDEHGDWRIIFGGRLIDQEEELELIRTYKDPASSPEARAAALEEITHAHMRYVCHMAGSMARRYRYSPDELISEGWIGLLRGLERYRLDSGVRFLSYASSWIQQAMQRAMENQRNTIRIPVHIQYKRARLRKIAHAALAMTGRELSIPELAELAGYSEAEAAAALEPSPIPESLDRNPESAGLLSVYELIPDPHVQVAEEAIESVEAEQLAAALSQLSAQERQVIRLRYGFEDGEPRTFAEVAAIMGVTRQRVQQVEVKAKARLSAMRSVRRLAS